MAVYRVLLMDGSGHIERSRKFEVPDDETAIALAEDVRAHLAIDASQRRVEQAVSIPANISCFASATPAATGMPPKCRC